MDRYFKANPDVMKFQNALPPFLKELDELFQGVVTMGNYVFIVNKALNQMENGPPIDPTLMEEESAATVQDGRSKKDESYNEEDDEVANEDEP